MHILEQYFGLPSGAVWSNILAEPIIVALSGVVVYLFRHKIGHTLVRWWHKHHMAHMKELADKERDRNA